VSVEEREAARRRHALDLLEELHVVERLSVLGPVEVTGAVRHRLVVDRDIDMDVTVDELDAGACFAAIGEIATDPRVLRIVYRNDASAFGWLAFDITCSDADGNAWIIELYVSTPAASFFGWTSELARLLEGVLTPDQRHAILELKEALVGDAEYRSMDVYRAVVDDGVRGTDDFLRWRPEHGSAKLARWLPGSVSPA
jgi:hypothetical protein